MLEIPGEEPDVGGVARDHPIRQITEQVPGQIERNDQRNRREHDVRPYFRADRASGRTRVAGSKSTGAELACGSCTPT